MKPWIGKSAVWACLMLLIGVALYKAWVTDDAYITFRTVENFVNGQGLTWNPGERVQVFTHTLWMFVMALAHAISGELFYTAIAINLLLTALAGWLFAFRLASSWHMASVGLIWLTASRALTDYSTSGLENALTHLLLVLALLTRRVWLSSLWVGMCILNHPDLALLVGPAWIALLWQRRSRTIWIPVLAGLSPLFLWEAFSLFYFGALVPNTAYAKLNTGIPGIELAQQGLSYLLNSLVNDPATLLGIVGAVVGSLILARLHNEAEGSPRVAAPVAAWSIGVGLALIYVVLVGGDFMSGRFLTPMLVVALGLFVSRSLPIRPALACCVIPLILLAVPWTSPLVERDYGAESSDAIDRYGIADERAFYGLRGALWSSWTYPDKWPDPKAFEEARWLHRHWPYDYLLDTLIHIGTLSRRDRWPPRSATAPDGTPYRKVFVRGEVGFLGYHLGPDTHVIDYHALGDPLLSRLPMTRPDPVLAAFLPQLVGREWRVGHYYRQVPIGYVRSIATGKNLIEDPQLREYYEVIRSVTRGALFDRDRLATILRLNLGQYDHLLVSPADVEVGGQASHLK